MRRSIRKYMNPSSYIHRWKKIRRRRKIIRLEHIRVEQADFSPLWKIRLEEGMDPGMDPGEDPGKDPGKDQGKDQGVDEVLVGAFGIPSDKEINWMKDVPGNHIFPSLRMDKIKMSDYYNRGIDVKYPWELSRFIFGNKLAARYARSGKKSHYKRFRNLVLDWIEGNPFLRGINWICTMDVAIRATNWILAANAFAKEISEDGDFRRLFSESLVKHAMYINAFPEIYPDKHTTNHTTADFVGLLYLSRALPGHPDSSGWQKRAVQELISCMEYQIYPDGGSFEASAGYHRLVTELFGLGALLCLKHKIELPDSYYSTLHSMFGFLFSICDRKGNSPLYGDNDSATLLQFDFDRNQDYSYMNSFYSLIFSHGTNKERLNMDEHLFLALMPAECRAFEAPSGARGLEVRENRIFRESGIMAFRRGDLSGNVYFMPVGLNGLGGHNHLDTGSFTLSYLGKPLLVDPGSYTYTRDLKLRNRYRDYSYHNTVIPGGIADNSFDTEKMFRLDPYSKTLHYGFDNEQKFSVSYSLLKHPNPIQREFFFEDDALSVTDTSRGPFVVKLHLAPGIKILETSPGLIRTSMFILTFEAEREFQLGIYDFAARYNTREESQYLSIRGQSTGKINFNFKLDE